MRLRYKLFIILGLTYYYCYKDLENLFFDMLKISPKIEGVFLLSPNSGDLKLKLTDKLNTQPLLFTLYGGDKHKVTCHKIDINSNYIYIVLDSFQSSNNSICNLDNEIIFYNIVNRIPVPFYTKLFGYNTVHFEVFGSYYSFEEEKLILDIKSLPYDSTLIVTAPSDDRIGIKSISDEVILESFNAYTNNYYIRFLHYIILNPVSSLFVINTIYGVKYFKSYFEELVDYSDEGIINWQKSQIQSFANFIHVSLTRNLESKNQEFKQLVQSYINDENSSLLAYQKSNLERFKELLMFSYIGSNQLEKIQALVRNNVDIESKLLNTATSLYLAAHMERLEIVQFLVNLNINLDAIRDDNKATALMVASFKGFIEIVKVLLNYNANPNIKDINNNTALTLSSMKGYLQITDSLIEHGADISLTYEKNIIIETLKANKFDVVRLILTKISDSSESNYHFNIKSASYFTNLNLLGFENFLINYVLKYCYDSIEAYYLISRIESMSEFEINIDRTREIKSCLLELDQNKCYHNLIELCGDLNNELVF